MNILHINLADQARGAAQAAIRLHKAQMKLGHTSHILVGYRFKNRPEIELFPPRNTSWQKNIFRFVNHVEERTGLQYLLQPWKKQIFRHPFVQQAEVIHLHNIHTGFFSHTVLPKLSRQKPMVWTLHDLWSMTGHCGFPYLHGCERWKTGCGRCPSLSDHPAIRIDTTALLWKIKSQVYRRSHFTLITPSEWMADIVRQSPLLEKFDIRCIPHGLDIKTFKPTSKISARKLLGLPENARIVLFSAFDVFQERKGGVYLFDALQRLYDEGQKNLLLLVMGSKQVDLGGKYTFPVQSLGLLRKEKTMALYYSAADVYAGPSLAEAFGLVYMEAMACGTPVIAFDCTAVPEVVRHLETGYLARTRDGDDFTHGLRLLLEDGELREKLSRQSRALVEREYTLALQAQRHLELYREAIDRHDAVGQSGKRSIVATGNGISNRQDFAARVAPQNRKGDLAYLIDRALAFRFNPADTLVISGFWRSGTTWIEEALREILYAKTLFEPIDPLLRDAQNLYVHHGVAGKRHEFLRMFMPYCNGENLEGHPLRELFHRALRSESPGSWVRRFRKELAESFRPRLVVKFVNAQLCLRAAQNTFGMPVLHVYRDPRAVIASIKKTRWHWLFDDLNLQEQLLDVPDGRAEYFSRWRDEILEFDRCSAVTRMAAYWALTEKFVQESYTDYRGPFVCVRYERLAQEREAVFTEILKKLNLSPWKQGFQVSEQDSTTTSRKQRGATVQERIAGWQKYLSTADIAAIESVIERLGLADRMMQEKVEMPTGAADERLA